MIMVGGDWKLVRCYLKWVVVVFGEDPRRVVCRLNLD